jgi:hypothetical protein
MRLKLAFAAALAIVAAVVTGATLTPAASAASGVPNLNAVPVQGTVPSIDGTFNGTADINHLSVQNGRLIASGTLTGTVLNAAGNTVGSVTDRPVSLPLSNDATGACQIADLRIGAIDLNLLGLVVHLDPVHLNVTAQQGPGNLLGNLLCMVTNLLNGNSSATGFLQPIVNLLNIVLARL